MIDESQIQEAVQVSFDDTSSIRFVPTRKKARGQVRKYKQMIKKENKKKIYKKMISLEECVRKSLAMEEELWFYLVDMTLTYRLVVWDQSCLSIVLSPVAMWISMTKCSMGYKISTRL